jgi:hypothetical protein
MPAVPLSGSSRPRGVGEVRATASIAERLDEPDAVTTTLTGMPTVVGQLVVSYLILITAGR